MPLNLPDPQLPGNPQDALQSIQRNFEAVATGFPHIAHFYLNLTGGWNAGNPTNATSGTSFTVPVTGAYLCLFGASWFHATGGYLGTITGHLNGSSTASITVKHYHNPSLTHQAATPQVASINLTAGTNYFWVKQAGTNVASDSNDFATFVGIKVI